VLAVPSIFVYESFSFATHNLADLRAAYVVCRDVHTESKYVEQKDYLSRYTHESAVTRRESNERLNAEFTLDWLRSMKEELSKFIPFLTRKCGMEFRGRVLEIGAGAAWFGAELSKLPTVVEVVVTDLSPRLLREQAPKVFKALKANCAKITRTPGDFHKLDFPSNHFDAVVCSSVLHQATNMVQCLREAKRVLKAGGKFIAIREPVWPAAKLKAQAKTRARLAADGVADPIYTLADYKEFFLQAGFPLEVKEVNLNKGFRHFVRQLVKNRPRSRYAFVGTKKSRALA
jgi:Methylase involved in ubiquinone/menaquinone biosynthesis